MSASKQVQAHFVLTTT